MKILQEKVLHEIVWLGAGGWAGCIVNRGGEVRDATVSFVSRELSG